MNQKSEGDKFKDTVQNNLETISSTMVNLGACIFVYMCSSLLQLAPESHNLSQAKKRITDL